MLIQYYFFFFQFCFPAGLKLSEIEYKPTFFCFTLTEITGKRFYGACLQAYDKISTLQLSSTQNDSTSLLGITDDDTSVISTHPMTEDDDSDDGRGDDDTFGKAETPEKTLQNNSGDNNTNTQYFVPHCLCILSRYPFFSTFRECLRELFLVYRTNSSLPVECYIEYLTHNLPVPRPGNTVQFRLFHRQIQYKCPSRAYFPTSDVSILLLF